MASLEEEVSGLLQSSRYNPDILPRLEAYVDHQLTSGRAHVDSDANIAVLKLYQFYPHLYRPDTVSKILIKALTTLPSTDFLTCLYLVPDARQVDEPLPVIAKLADLLETGAFVEFWEAAGACRQLLESVPGSLDAVRHFMLGVVKRTYKTIDVDVLGRLLDLNHDAVARTCQEAGWSIEGAVVVIPANDENQPKAPTGDEFLSFAMVAKKMLVGT